ncbi:hypothetical protein EBB07_09250 [Paenibacillaceae bacterium]|nr:hypothetical protein EBB07_09250 [Paenibacillaceae bacterium]
MRKSVLFGIILVLLGAAGLGYVIRSGGKLIPENMISTFAKEVNKTREMDVAEFRNLQVNSESANVRFISGGGEVLTARLHGYVPAKHAEYMDVKLNERGDTLELNVVKRDGFLFGFSHMTLDIEVPEKLWDAIRVEISSGNVELDGLNSDQVIVGGRSGRVKITNLTAATGEIKLSSGNITVENADTNTLDLATSSGSIKLSDVQSETIELKSSSGNIRMENFDANQVNFKTSSGSVKLEEGAGELKGSTTSGNIKVAFAEMKHDMDLKATSGSVKVKLDSQPENVSVDFKGSSGSGKIEWDGFVYEKQSDRDNTIRGKFGDGGKLLKVRTSSGSFRLEN